MVPASSYDGLAGIDIALDIPCVPCVPCVSCAEDACSKGRKRVWMLDYASSYAFIFIIFDSFVDDARPAPTATAL